MSYVAVSEGHGYPLVYNILGVCLSGRPFPPSVLSSVSSSVHPSSSSRKKKMKEGLKSLLETNCIKGMPIYHYCVPLLLNPKGREGSSFFWPNLRATHHAQSPQPRNGERERGREQALWWQRVFIHPIIHPISLTDCHSTGKSVKDMDELLPLYLSLRLQDE
jgi:hypothetical protein